MATIVKTFVLDDVDGTEGATTVRFGLDGVEYEIDLSSDNEASLRSALATFVEHARKVKTDTRAKRVTHGTKERLAQIRQWARENGHEVSDRGRVSGAVISAYEASLRAAVTETSEAPADPQEQTQESPVQVIKDEQTDEAASPVRVTRRRRATTPKASSKG
jgi:hypothetical protein